MAGKLKAPVEQISEDIVEQELVLPSEETIIEETPKEKVLPEGLTGYPSRDFFTPLS